MAIAFVGGFWLTRWAMSIIGDDTSQQVEVLNERSGGLKTGDIIFQTSISSQSFAIQKASSSVYSHMGLVENIENKFFVLEAVQPVKRTPLQEWIDRGKGGKYAIKRLENFDYLTTDKGKDHWDQISKSYLGKNYDIYFDWSDDAMYCSELVWKVYNQLVGLEIGSPKELQYFDLKSEEVRKKLVERYGDSIPWDQKIISPQDIFDSPLLKEISSNY